MRVAATVLILALTGCPLLRASEPQSTSQSGAMNTSQLNESRTVIVESIRWNDVHAFPVDELEHLSAVQPGDQFERAKISETIDRLTQLYRSAGYSAFKVTADVQPQGPYLVEVRFTLIEGVQEAAKPK